MANQRDLLYAGGRDSPGKPRWPGPYLIRRGHTGWSPATGRNVKGVHHSTRTDDVTLTLTDYQAKYFAHELTRRFPPDSVEKLTAALVDAQVDLVPASYS